MQTLTRTEYQALRATYNLADGHAHQPLNSSQATVIAQMPALFQAATSASQEIIEREFISTFFRHLDQSLTPESSPILLYSASIAIQVVARLLEERRLKVGLVTPTFDNIPDLLRAQGVSPLPVPEQLLLDPSTWDQQQLEALFLVHPNNPTGWTMTAAEWRTLAREAADRDLLLVIDFSFRYFSATQIDTYSLLQEEGCRFISIEDTGKFLSALDLKAGILMADIRTLPDLRLMAEDILLNMSPFTLTLLRHLLEADDRKETLRLISENRRQLYSATDKLGFLSIGKLPTLSVEWLTLTSGKRNLATVMQRWREQGIFVLPGGPFFWHQPSEGASCLRIALARDPEQFKAAVCRLSEVMAILEKEGDNYGQRHD